VTVDGHDRRWRILAALAAVLLVAGGAACGDDDGGGRGDDPDDDLGEQAESAAARVVAEALRVVLVADDGPDTDRRTVAVLEESVADLPGEPDVSGISDEDGDGLDDDGAVEVSVNDEVACLTVTEEGDVDVTGGAC
jgi:hypothetical protein